MTPTSLLSEDHRRRIAAFVVWGRPGQFLTKRQIERRVEKILERIASKSGLGFSSIKPVVVIGPVNRGGK